MNCKYQHLYQTECKFDYIEYHGDICFHEKEAEKAQLEDEEIKERVNDIFGI